MERQGQDQRIGEDIGDTVGIEQGRYLGLPAVTAKTFGDIEDHTPSVTGGKPFGQGLDGPDPVGLMAHT